MKVVLLPTPPLTEISGVSTHVYMLAKGLVDLGHAAIVIETNPPDFIRLPLIRGPETVISWFSLYGSRRYRRWVEDVLYLIIVLWKTRGRFDVLNLQNIRLAAMGAWLRRRCHCAVIATIHGYVTYEAESDNWCSIGDKSHQWLWRTETTGYDKADAIICVADKTKNYVSQFTAKPISVIHNGLDTGVFCPGQNPQVQARVVVLFSGAVQTAKGIFTALAAIHYIVKQGKDLLLRVAGKGDQTEEAKQYVLDRHLEQYVEFLGPVAKTKMPEFYQSGEILLFPSQTAGLSGVSEESSPYSILEAMACGLAVVAFQTGGIREQVRDGVDGYLIQPGNEDELARKLGCLIDDPDLRQKMGENARAHCVNRFSHIQMAQNYLNVFSETQRSFDCSRRGRE